MNASNSIYADATAVSTGLPALTKPQVKEFVEIYLSSRDQWARGTLVNTTRYLRQFAKKLPGPMTWPSFKTAFDATVGTSCAGTHNNIQMALQQFERWLCESGQAQVMFSNMVQTATYIRPKRQVVTYQEWQKLLEAATPPYDWMLKTQWMTGLSMCDSMSLEWKSVQLGPMLLRLVRKKTAKRGKECIIPIIAGSPMHLELLDRDKVKLQTLGQYPSVNGKHYVDNDLAMKALRDSNQNMQRELDYIIKRAGVRRVKWHDFRATFCTAACAVGDPMTVLSMTGHSDVDMLKSYVTVSVDKLRRISQDADALLKQ